MDNPKGNDKDTKKTAGNGEETEKLAVKASQLLKMLEEFGKLKATSESADQPKVHKFWSTQPVLDTSKVSDSADLEDGPLHPPVDYEHVQKEPYPLPPEFKWSLIDINDEKEKVELYQLLNMNYVEDVESLFRFDYPANFLEWALKPPGWKKEWHLGVRVTESNKLVAFISAIPCSLNVRSWNLESVEVNFLCVHKKLRDKRLAPLLIKEVTRRVHLFGIFQAMYTAGAVLPGVMSEARYFHRPLNFQKLCETGFAGVPIGKTMDSMLTTYYLAKEHGFGASLRPMTEADVPKVTEILDAYLTKFPMRPKFTEEEVHHWLLPREDIMYTYVVCNGENVVTDFISFYSLPSTVVGNTGHASINAAYLFYYAAQSNKQLEKLVNAALILAKASGFDVFNCVEILDNGNFVKSLKFGEGDGQLHYYLFNWKTRPFKPSEVALVML